ncbi:hypothetical protein LCI18_013742 [Fusarium solani-melongenae]|uniref:Uncharacterized protein n=1 Tax=Fusarium solani subsp. cucurbitae TaxID=2747967 RepID=A0ACD3ZPD1_FUSSC|nr:hypothetical protein LCI18_013742 [Fusarium solani-melongenae]
MYVTEDLKRKAPLPHHEILQEARGQMEISHRQLSFLLSTLRCPEHYCLGPPATHSRSFSDVRDLSPMHAEDCCNTSVSIYIITSPDGGAGFALRYALHNWLYHKWFQPFRSEIEYGQFVAKQFYAARPQVDTPPASMVELTNELQKRMCDQVTTFQREVVSLPKDLSFPRLQFRDQRFYILQPLFRASTIILLAEDFDVRVIDMGKLPVLLTLTGDEHGLSQRLSFESIRHHVEEFISETAVQVRLRVAIEFILAQQERETAAFGPQPDPVESTKGLQNGLGVYLESFMRAPGWGDEPVVTGPSSTWVDTEVCTGWSRASASEDERYY